MSLTKEILRITAKYYPIGYSQLFEYIYEETVYGRKLNKRSVHAIINRLEKNGLIQKKVKGWSITSSGKIILNSSGAVIKKFFNPGSFKEKIQKPKNQILIFDIPEKRKRWREWLRSELVGFGFTMIQKSVWLGPPLPQDFIKYLNENGILRHIRFFRVDEKDII